ncbi:MAG: amidohydrolase/deacetylase family metallohydrolase [Anaerolineae bacterium]|nr:amidohydrolase/deacetylase family metallohydrolase [Anaerolineae bacterium]
MTAPETSKEQFDILLKGGHVIDPKNNLSKKLDVAISQGKIAAVAENIPASKAQKVIDLSGLYVVPGLIDMHVHVYPQHFQISIVADGQSFSSGVTTMVDAGSSGAANFGDFKERVIDKSKTRILAFLNVVDLGMGGDFEQDVSRMNPQIAAGIAKAYPELIVGIKVAHYWTWKPWDKDHQPWDNVERGVEAGELCGKPVMVDFWPRPPERSYADLILKKLRPGDIHTHVFAQQFPIIDESGKVNKVLFQARERGIIFDVGHGAASFWFRNAVPAVKQGFIPDSISTDLHTGNAANGLVTNILNVMSKFLNMGLSLEDVISRATLAPAREIGHPELGNLDVGAEADVAVLRLQEGQFSFIDCGKARMDGTKKLECVLTLRKGEIVFDPGGLSMPAWEEAPEDYWICQPPHGAPKTWRPPAKLY